MYKNWTELLGENCAIRGLTRRAASLEMGFAPGYLEGIEKERFKPSRKRCLKIAEYFEVDANEVLALADLYVAPPESDVANEIASEAADLPLLTQRFLLQVVRALKVQHRMEKD